MRLTFLSLFFAMIASALAQQTSASDQLKRKFIVILNQQLSEMVTSARAENPQATDDQIAKHVDDLVAKAISVYDVVITLPDNEAHRLLTIGPDDKANMAAMKHAIELWKKVERPMPVLYKRMQGKVTNGEIKDGLELELTRRISEFHLHQLGML